VRTYAPGVSQGAAYASFDNVYTGGFRNLLNYLDGTGGVVASQSFQQDGGYAISVGGVLTQVKTMNAATGGYDVAYLNIASKPYTSYDIVYNAGGKTVSETWSNAGALYQTETWNTDGSVNDIHYYKGGTFQGVSYASYDDAYTAGSRASETFYDASGATLVAESFPSGGGAVSVKLFGSTTLTIAGSSNENVIFDSAANGTLKLNASTAFTGAVSGFGANDALDLANLAFGPKMTVGYSANPGGAGGTLSVGNGKQTAAIALLGDYAASSFALSADGHGGTNVVIPQPMAGSFAPNPLLS
jgi:hypothetical protein